MTVGIPWNASIGALDTLAGDERQLSQRIDQSAVPSSLGQAEAASDEGLVLRWGGPEPLRLRVRLWSGLRSTDSYRLGRFLGLHCAFAARRAGADAAIAWDGQRSGKEKNERRSPMRRARRHLPPSAPRAAGKCTRRHLTWAILWWRPWRPRSKNCPFAFAILCYAALRGERLLPWWHSARPWTKA